MSVGHLLLKSFWANEAVFQMMMLAYNMFLLFKFDSLSVSEYRQQIKTFRLSAYSDESGHRIQSMMDSSSS